MPVEKIVVGSFSIEALRMRRIYFVVVYFGKKKTNGNHLKFHLYLEYRVGVFITYFEK